jgi:hypothetical protein
MWIISSLVECTYASKIQTHAGCDDISLISNLTSRNMHLV